MYFVITELSRINNMYRFSLASFLRLFQRALQAKKVTFFQYLYYFHFLPASFLYSKTFLFIHLYAQLWHCQFKPGLEYASLVIFNIFSVISVLWTITCMISMWTCSDSELPLTLAFFLFLRVKKNWQFGMFLMTALLHTQNHIVMKDYTVVGSSHRYKQFCALVHNEINT